MLTTNSEQPVNASRNRRIGLAVVIATFLLFVPCAFNEFVNYDDPLYVTKNRFVQNGISISGVVQAFTSRHATNWHPLTWLSLQLDSTLFNNQAWGYHLTNVLLHALNAGLVFWVVVRYTHEAGRAVLVACLFAFHPLRVEAVAWISERKELLGAFFGLLGLAAYHSYVALPNRRAYASVVLLFTLSLLAKPMWVTFPCLLLLLDIWPLKRWGTTPGQLSFAVLLREKLPLFLITIASCAITFYAQSAGGAVARLQTVSPVERVSNAIVSYVIYVCEFLWPVHLAPFYPLTRGAPSPLVIWGSLALLVTLTVLFLWQRRSRPCLLFGWLWYLGTLVPVIGLVQVGSQSHADRYTYLPMIGLTWGIVWAACELSSVMPVWALRSVAVLLLVAAGVLTELQIAHWRNSERLWNYTLGVTKNNWLAHCNLAVELSDQARFDGSRQHFEASLAIQPNAPAYIGLGGLLARTEQMDKAIESLQQGLALDPDSELGHGNLGVQYAKMGRFEEAASHFQEAIRIAPGNAEHHLNLGMALEYQRKEGAAESYARALEADPHLAAAHLHLGMLLGSLGNFAEATRHLEEAIRSNPNYAEAWYSLACFLEIQGQREPALNAFRRAIDLEPNSINFRQRYAIALRAANKTQEAAAQEQEAERLSEAQGAK